MKNFKNMSMQYAVDYFKEKSKDLNVIYTLEITKIFE